jgi:predicted CoA-binding protein
VSEIPEGVDVVDVFRRPEDEKSLIDDVIRKKGIKVIWMQSGIYNEEPEKKAKENGIEMLFNRCIMVEHRHYLQ